VDNSIYHLVRATQAIIRTVSCHLIIIFVLHWVYRYLSMPCGC